MHEHSAQHREDLELAALIMAGNSDAEEKFFAKYRLWIQKEVRRQGVSAADVEDVAQTSCWQRSINCGAANFTRRVRLKRGSIKLCMARSRIIGASYRPDESSCWQVQTRSQRQSNWKKCGDCLRNLDPELVIAVHEVLRQMPEKLKLVLVLNRTGGYTMQEISHPLALTAGQVAKHLYKAEEMFRRLLRSDERDGKKEHGKAVTKRRRLKSGDGNLVLFICRSLMRGVPERAISNVVAFYSQINFRIKKTGAKTGVRVPTSVGLLGYSA